MVSERWIVVGTDFSDGSSDALARALTTAEGLGAHVALVHAYEDAADPGLRDDRADTLMEELARQIAASGASRRGIRVEAVVRRGPPWEKILNVATEYGAEMVFVGRCGQRGALHGALLGSVASRVLALSKRCVVVAPALATSEKA